MARNWTPEQRSAFETRDRSLLVSAAAGSGKTAVLTERVIRSLTEGDHPLELSRLLVVTFTHAAAGELKERIGAALSEAIRQHPSDPHLARQMRLLPSAQISTIHSFCLTLLRRYYHHAGIKPDVRVSDDSESKPLRAEMMTTLVEDAYANLVEGVTNAELRLLVEDLGMVRRADAFVLQLLLLYNDVCTTREGVSCVWGYANTLASEAEMPLFETRWGKELRENTLSCIEHTLGGLERTWQAVAKEPVSRGKVAPVYDEYVSYLRRLARLCGGDYSAFRDAVLTYKAPKFPQNNSNPKPGAFYHTDAVAELKSVWTSWQTYEKEHLREKFLTYSEENWRELFRRMGARVATVAALLCEFDRRYRAEMIRRGAVDYNQLERFAYELLWRDGKTTDLCREIADGYDAVYVDEYQDVSPLQHALFEQVGKKNNRFMVGDIKQSIYRFRHADPDIFASLKRSMPPLKADDPDQNEASVFMSDNFRCDETVVAFVNQLFDFLFENAGESIAYVPEDRLHYSKNPEGMAEKFPVRCAFFNPDGAIDPHEILDAAPEDLPTEEEDLPREEALWIAKEIHDLLENGTLRDGKTPIQPKDIAILLRSVKGDKTKGITEALSRWGIPVSCAEKRSFFLNPEVQLALCLLNVIDNPRRDIYLTGALCSPLYQFTADELAILRRESDPEACLYESVVEYCAAHPAFGKGQAFLAQLADFRREANGIPVYRLLNRIYRETPLMAVAGREGRGGETNLKLLYNHARTAEGIAFCGLCGFIRYINGQISVGQTLPAPKLGNETNAVQIVSMHGSKGLEYPVVFVAGCGSEFYRQPLYADLLLDGELGIAMKTRSPAGAVRVDNPLRMTVSHKLARLQNEEEMRLFYVALTRARERLYVTGTAPRTAAKEPAFSRMVKKMTPIAKNPDRYGILRLNSFMEMTLCALLANGEVVEPTVCDEVGTYREEAVFLPEGEGGEEIAATLRARFAYTYPYGHLTALPKKMSVSRLTPNLLDGTEDERVTPSVVSDLVNFEQKTEECKVELAQKPLRLPKILQEEQEPGANEKGSATHQFLQFCDFTRLWEDGTDKEIDRLLSLGYLDDRTASLIRRGELERFRTSRLFREMREAKEVKRELRFHIRLPAEQFTRDADLSSKLVGNSLYVQGVMDAVICHEDGTVTLVDYKTDRLTREELADKTKAAKKLVDRHRAQLTYYTAAVERIFGQPPRAILLYSLPLGDTVEVR